MRTFADDQPLVWARAEGATIWDEDGREYLDLYAGFAVADGRPLPPPRDRGDPRQAGAADALPVGRRRRASAPSCTSGCVASPRPASTARCWRRHRRDGQRARDRAGSRRHRPAHGDRASRAPTSAARAAPSRHAGKHAYREQLRRACRRPVPAVPRSRSARRGPRAATSARWCSACSSSASRDPASGVDPPAAIVVEPIQGNGGVVHPPGRLPGRPARAADRHGALLVFDEIQCGFGRTGAMWASQHRRRHARPDDGRQGHRRRPAAGRGAGHASDVMSTWTADATTSTFLTNALNERAGLSRRSTCCATRGWWSGRGAGRPTRSLGCRRAGRQPAGRRRQGAGPVRRRSSWWPDPGSDEPDRRRAARAVRELRDRGVIVGRRRPRRQRAEALPAARHRRRDLEPRLDIIVEVLST